MSKRQERVNELLKREISTVLQRDFQFKEALVTISAVETTPDLKEAKVFIGVLGKHANQVLEKIKQSRGQIQSAIAKRVVLRNTPILAFRHDTSAQRGLDINHLLDDVAKLPTAPPEEVAGEEE